METIIEKSRTIVPDPILRDYDDASRTFQWKDAYDRIEWFDDGRLNIAASKSEYRIYIVFILMQ